MPNTPLLIASTTPIMRSLPFSLKTAGALPGTLLEYKVLAPLGEGGMGAVYRAVAPDARQVAIKLLLSPDPALRDRFIREIEAVKNLQHPNIVRTLGFGEDSIQGPFLVMELLQGETLFDYLSSQPHRRLPVEKSAAIAAQIAGALLYAQSLENPLMYRDLKPENVFVCDKAERHGAPAVKLIDFGLARCIETSAGGVGTRKKLTQQHIALGTPQFMAPEQCLGQPKPASDVYALGLMTYLMIEGHFPFPEAIKDDLEKLIVWHTRGEPREMAACSSPTLRELLTQMMSRRHSDRPNLASIERTFHEFLHPSSAVPIATASTEQTIRAVSVPLPAIDIPTARAVVMPLASEAQTVPMRTALETAVPQIIPDDITAVSVTHYKGRGTADGVIIAADLPGNHPLAYPEGSGSVVVDLDAIETPPVRQRKELFAWMKRFFRLGRKK